MRTLAARAGLFALVDIALLVYDHFVRLGLLALALAARPACSPSSLA